MIDTLRRVLILPDAHTPYHNRRSLERLIMAKVMPAFQWYALLILGDWFDNYAVSRFTKSTSRLSSLKAELAEGFKLLRMFKDSGLFERLIFIEGNHEKRLPKMVDEKAPAISEIIQEWWSTKFDGFEYVPYMDDIRIGKLFATHDVGYAGESSTKQSLHTYQDNMVMGHNHLFDMHVRGNAKGIPHVGASFGWLGDVEKVDYRHRMKARSSYVQGFGVGYLRQDGVIYLNPKPIVGGTCEVEGKLYAA